MADVITRFKLETTQYDSKLRDTAKGISDVAHQAELAGQGFNNFSQKSVEAARALGQTASGATNAKDKVRDLVGAYNEAAKAYNKLTQEQQQSDFGKALAQSLTTLQQRIKETKQELYGIGNAVEQVKSKSSGLFGEGGLTGMLAVTGGNLLASGIAQLGSEIADTMQKSIELARAGEGVRNAFERLNNPGLLNNLKEATHGTVSELELMKAAVKFNDFRLPVEELGTMLAFAQQKAKDTGQSVDYMVDSIVTGLGRKSLMILDNLGLSAAEIKEKMAETGDMTKAVGEIIREQMAKAGDYTETAADRAARATADVQDKMLELGSKLQPLAEEGASMWNSLKLGGLTLITNVLDPLIQRYTHLGQLMQQYGNLGGGGKVQNMLGMLGNGGGRAQGTFQRQQQQFWNYINPREEYLKNLDRWRKGERSDQLRQAVNQGRERFGIDDRAIRAQVDAAKKMLREYQEGAKKILQPVETNINTDKSIKGVDDLKKKLKELEAQRRKAVLAGDNEQVDNLTKQINATKQNIGYLDPKALKTTSGTNPQEQAAKQVAEAQRVYAETIAKADMELKAGLTTDADVKKKTLAAQEQLYSAYGKAYATYADPKYKEAQDKAAAEIVKLGGEVKTSVDAQKKVQEAARELERAQKKLADAQAKLAEAQKTGDLKQVYAAQKAVTSAQKEVTTAQTNVERVKREITEVVNVEPGKVELPDVPKAVTVPITYTSGNLDAFISNLKEQISQADIGSELHNKLTAQLADATTLGTLMQTAIQNGIDTAQFNPQDLWKKVFGDTPGDYVENADWQSIVDKINEKLKELKLEPIKIDFSTGNVKKQSKEMSKDWKAAASAIQDVGSAMSQIEDPAAKVVGTVAQAIATIALSYAQALKMAAETSGPWAWIAFAGTGLGTMLSSIAAIHSATGYAEGGMIKGNSYSGDNLMAQGPDGQLIGLNAGEVVLNRAQANVIAGALQGGGQTVRVVGKLSGESIFICAENWAKRTGKGEFVTWR